MIEEKIKQRIAVGLFVVVVLVMAGLILLVVKNRSPRRLVMLEQPVAMGMGAAGSGVNGVQRVGVAGIGVDGRLVEPTSMGRAARTGNEVRAYAVEGREGMPAGSIAMAEEGGVSLGIQRATGEVALPGGGQQEARVSAANRPMRAYVQPPPVNFQDDFADNGLEDVQEEPTDPVVQQEIQDHVQALQERAWDPAFQEQMRLRLEELERGL